MDKVDGAGIQSVASLIRMMLLVASAISVLVALTLALGVIPSVAAGEQALGGPEGAPGPLRVILWVQLTFAALFAVLGLSLRRRSRLVAFPLGFAALSLIAFTITFVYWGMDYFEAGPGLKAVAPFLLLAGLGDFLAFTLCSLGAYRSLKT